MTMVDGAINSALVRSADTGEGPDATGWAVAEADGAPC